MAKKDSNKKHKDEEQTTTSSETDYSFTVNPEIIDSVLANTSLTGSLSSDLTTFNISKLHPTTIDTEPLNFSSMPLADLNTFRSWEIETQGLISNRYDLVEQLQEAKNEIREYQQDQDKQKQARKKAEDDAKKLSTINKELEMRQALGTLLTQVNEVARKRLLESEDFRQVFEQTKDCEAFVISIDIRRSTELMLKAKHPELFEKFITSLCHGLSDIILRNFGIWDKFTGDGILAFFPDFFTGPDAGLLAVKSAIDCHEFFEKHYRDHRNCFTTVLQNTGLGIGIDSGSSYLVRMGGPYTLIGAPVVYACRMSGANAGETLLNQTAYEEIFEKYKQFLNIEETSIDIKHEGPTLAYNVTWNNAPLKFNKPDWIEAVNVVESVEPTISGESVNKPEEPVKPESQKD